MNILNSSLKSKYMEFLFQEPLYRFLFKKQFKIVIRIFLCIGTLLELLVLVVNLIVFDQFHLFYRNLWTLWMNMTLTKKGITSLTM